jgi:hypothetical protein
MTASELTFSNYLSADMWIATFAKIIKTFDLSQENNYSSKGDQQICLTSDCELETVDDAGYLTAQKSNKLSTSDL